MGDYDILYNTYEVKRDGKSGVLGIDGKEILPLEYDEVSVLNNYGTFIVGKKGNKKVAVPIDSPKPEKLIEYDFTGSGKGYVRKGDTFEEYDLMSMELEKSIPVNELKLYGNQFNIIFRDGKFGAADFEGKILVPCEYDYATFMEFRDEVMIGYQNGTKYYIYVDNNERFTEDQW